MSEAESQSWTAQDLYRELHRLGVEDAGAVAEAVAASDRRTMMEMVKLVTHYDDGHPDLPEDIKECRKYQLLVTRAQTSRGYTAVRHGDVSSMRYLAGSPDRDSTDSSSFGLIQRAKQLFKPSDRDHMLNLVVYAPPPPVGPTGVGKTDFAYTLIDAGRIIHDDLNVASNNTSDEFEDVQSWSELEDWLDAQTGTKVFLWDEAAQVLQFDDINAGRALSRLIKLLRKHNCHLIVVGHTGKDIPKDIRRMVLFAQKKDKKTAIVGSGLTEDNKGWMQIDNVLYRLTDIPATSISYSSTGDTGTFVFDQDDEEDDDEGDDGGLDITRCSKDSCGLHTGNSGQDDVLMLEATGYCTNHVPDDVLDDL